MRCSMVGLGKLGGPVAVAFTEEHRVWGYDNNPDFMKLRAWEQQEEGINGHSFQEMFQESVEGGYLKFTPLEECVQASEIVFVAVQTPHKPELDGTQQMASEMEKADFDYTHLKSAVGQVVRAAKLCTHRPVLAVISTVLPGTIRREILPLVDGIMPVTYCPQFAAMGTVIRDVLDPEFVLVGGDDAEPKGRVMNFFRILCPSAPQSVMGFESAELVKCSYNLMVSMKIGTINSLTEVAHKIPGCSVDDVSKALSLAQRRLWSSAYLKPGGSDGGACLTEDTKIPLLDGREVPVRELVGMEEFYVYSYDLTKKEIVPGRAHSCRKTGKRRKIVEVELDDGSKIRCTPDHLFLLRSGDYAEAKDLLPGNRLMPLYRTAHRGYEQLRQPTTGKREPTHRMVRRWKYGEEPSDACDTHHEDFNKRNNHPDNIIAVEPGNHASLHNNQPHRKRQQSKIIKRLNKEGKINDEQHRRQTTQRNLTDNPMDRLETREKMRVNVTKTMRRMVKEGTHHTVTNNPTHQLMEEGRHNFQTDHPMKDPAKLRQMTANLNDYYAHRAGFASHAESVEIVRAVYEEEGRSIKKTAARLKLSRGFVRYRLFDNHRVVAVRPAGFGDVYNFEVDVYENYAVSQGVLVHNCHPRDAIAMSWLADELGLSSDPFGVVMENRERHVEWLADLICKESKKHRLPIILLGKAFKADSNITAGSYAILLANVLKDWGVLFIHHDPLTGDSVPWGEARNGPYVVFVATKHKEFASYRFAHGSVILDPHRFILPQEGVEIIRIGEGK